METRSLIHRWVLLGAVLVVVMTGFVRAGAQEPDHYDPDDMKTWPDVVTEDRDVSVREQLFRVHFYRPRNDKAAIPAIYACGDGGWRGLAPRTAQQLAHLGFAVAGIDSKVYLREYSSPQHPLRIDQLAHDYADVARALRVYAKVDEDKQVYVYGWSLGAGFAIAVGSDPQTRANWAGIVSIGLPKQNQLVSGTRRESRKPEQRSKRALRVSQSGRARANRARAARDDPKHV